jgi:hypothetical protein
MREHYHWVPPMMRLVQVSPTPREASSNPVRPRRPAAAPTSGLLVDVNVLQHDNDPVLHWLAGVVPVFGGGKPPSPLATGVIEAATLLAAARPATKETSGL